MSEAEKKLRAFIAERVHSADAERENNALLDATLSSARDAALEEAARAGPRAATESLATTTRGLADDIGSAIRALQSVPAQVVSVEKVREVLRRAITSRKLMRDPVAATHDVAEGIGIDLDAAPAKAPTPSTARHWLNDVQECSDECPACLESMARGLNPDGTAPDGV